MRLQHSPAAEVHSEGQTSEFKIRASGAAFRLLSSGLYSDKIGAVLREIGCNAYDAHTAAGCNHIPFEVKLPNAGDPLFYIKDFGLGLDDAGVREVYTTYFESTKQESDDFTGAFGLGSKSPFSYTESFTITAVKDGVKRVYAAHLTAQGKPAVTLMAESEIVETDAWQSGVMVSFPVQTSDFAEFEVKAKTLYRYFATMPRILGSTAEFPPATFTLEGDILRWQPEDGEGHASAVLMGNVLYPLAFGKLGLNSNEWFTTKAKDFADTHRDVRDIQGLESALRNFSQSGAYFKVSIGSVQVTASREHLEYDPHSRQVLTETMLDAMVEFARHVRSLVDDESATQWERRLNCKAFVKDKHGANRFEKGHVLAWWAYAGLPTDRAEYFFEDVVTVPGWLGGQYVKAQYVGEKTGNRLKSAWSKPILNGYVSGDRLSVPIRNDIAIVIADTGYSVERVKGAVNNGNLKAAIVLSGKKSLQDMFDRELDALATEMGNPPVLKASELDAVSIKKYVSSNPGTPRQTAPAIALLSKLCDVRYVCGPNAGSARNMALGALPDDCKYFLLTEKEGGRRTGATYWTDNPESGRPHCHVLQGSDVKDLFTTFAGAVKQGVPVVSGLNIAGYVKVNATELKRLKLEEQGFAPILPTIAAQLASMSAIRAFGLALEGFPAQQFSQTAGQWLVTALKEEGPLAHMVKRLLGKTALGKVLASQASGFAPTLTPQQKALKHLLREWGSATSVNDNLQLLKKLLSSSEESTNVDKLVATTVPGWAEFASRMGYRLEYWGDNKKDSTLAPGFEAMYVALLTPASVNATAAASQDLLLNETEVEEKTSEVA